MASLVVAYETKRKWKLENVEQSRYNVDKAIWGVSHPGDG